MKRLLPIMALCAVLIAICACVIIPAAFPSLVSLDWQVTIEALHNVTQEQPTLAKIGSKYYASTPSLMFCSYFYFGSWELMDEVREGNPVITLEFSEQWVMELHKDSLGCYATVYNGSGGLGFTRTSATYRIPLTVIERLTHYFENNGIPHYWGDGTIGPDSFAH